MSKKAILMILDGWGINENPKVSAIAQAKTPFIDDCFNRFPHSTLVTYGYDVGLPAGQMGNSEVGHMNLGAGRVVYQNLAKINLAVENNSLIEEPVLRSAFEYAKVKEKKLHFIGLVSDGGVHSHINHLKGLLTAAKESGLDDNVFIHAFTDGRDCDPHSGKGFIEELIDHTKVSTGKLASIVGRYYAMDRDKRWERVKIAYDTLVNAKGTLTKDPLSVIQKSYDEGITDEFLDPIIVTDNFDHPIAKIEDGDVVICFNFRTDRGREITDVLTQNEFPDFGMKKLDLYYVTLTQYDETFHDVYVVFSESQVEMTLGEVIEKAGLQQIRIAETEKYPHVTFFFSGGRETAFIGESRILCPSPRDVATYDLKPEMSAYDIRNAIIPELKKGKASFVCLNFANTDMVGHTGDFKAAMKAAEVVDECASEVVKAALENDYFVIILADHGNSDTMINPDGSPNTQHTTNPVPVILAQNTNQWKLKDGGKLGDIAPTILTLMEIPVPDVMTGNVLVYS